MLSHDEKRDYIRMEVDCDITYKLANSNDLHTGRCTNLSGAGISFMTDQSFEPGLAMEVSIVPKSNITPPMTAFIEVVRSVKHDGNQYEIAAVIKTITGK